MVEQGRKSQNSGAGHREIFRPDSDDMRWETVENYKSGIIVPKRKIMEPSL
jgi:hypothetical protein